MLDLKFVRQNADAVADNCQRRNVKADIPALLQADEETRRLKGELDTIRKRRNDISGAMKGKLSKEERMPLVDESKALKESEAKLNTDFAEKEAERKLIMSAIPNMTHPASPDGKTDEENVTIREVGEVPKFDFEPKDHVQLMEALDLIEFDKGSEVAGQKFYFLKNEAVFLEMALVQYALTLLRAEGFTAFITPDLAKMEILEGIGFNPRGEETQIYSVNDSDLCLIATAEITLGGRMRGETIDATELPVLQVGYSHCFRTEAGAYGRESRGLYRVHQFTKVEMFAFVLPEESEAMHDKLLAIEERIYKELELPYRVMDICTGDLGAPAYRKYDIEAWMPGRDKYGEVTSTSNCTDYQSRRLNIKFKDAKTGRKEFVHMLNGTAIAISRTLIALIENGQQADGSIKLPKVLNMPDIPARG